MTDYSDEVLERCRHNIRLPCNQLSSREEVSAQHLSWFDCLEDSPHRPAARAQVEAIAADVVIGSDLIYDATIIPPLVSTLALTLEISAPVGAFIALAIRRTATFDLFKETLSASGLTFADIPLDTMVSATSKKSALDVANDVRLLHIQRSELPNKAR